jgi:hypothetical protein
LQPVIFAKALAAFTAKFDSSRGTFGSLHFMVILFAFVGKKVNSSHKEILWKNERNKWYPSLLLPVTFK